MFCYERPLTPSMLSIMMLNILNSMIARKVLFFVASTSLMNALLICGIDATYSFFASVKRPEAREVHESLVRSTAFILVNIFSSINLTEEPLVGTVWFTVYSEKDQLVAFASTIGVML